jgi:F-box interacting protein
VAATVALKLPEDIVVWEIFIRLPAKEILRCRAVCRSWHGLTSAHDFLRAHHRRQPSLPLVTLYGSTTTSTKGALPFLERGRPVLGFDDFQDFRLIASCDGLLLLYLSDGRYSICNPITRQCAPLPCLTAAGRIDIAALYLHGPSGEYRVLYRKCGVQEHVKVAYYILMVRRGRSPRCIEVPSDTPNIEKHMRASNRVTSTDYAPPVVFRSCLHWYPGNGVRIAVFDTVVESFRIVSRPAEAIGSYGLLCDMEGSIGFSCFDDGRTATKIWLLEDYEREVWSLKYHVKFPVESLSELQDARHLVLSHKGDVLVYSRSQGYIFHYDNTGKLLEEFKCDPLIIGHWFKENLVRQDISMRRGCGCVKQLRFFRRI